MPSLPTDPRTYSEAAIASLSALGNLDPSASAMVARMIGDLRAKYPATNVGPGNPIDPT